MGKKTKTSFRKGNLAAGVGNKNAKGRTQADREELAMKKIDAGMVTRYFTLNSHLTIHELIARLQTERVSVLEGMIIKGMIQAQRSGDTGQINFFLDRLIGKVPNKIEHEVKNPYKDMSIEELMQEKQRLNEINRKTLNIIEATNERVINQNREIAAYVNATGNSADSGVKGN